MTRVFTTANFDPIARMNAAKDAHRAKGTTGGAGGARHLTSKERFTRDDGLTREQLMYAKLEAIYGEFRSWVAQDAIKPLGDSAELDNDFPF